MYGFNDDMRALALDKIKRQKKYLAENGVEVLGQSFRLIDFFKNSFINSDRYIAEVNNRVSSLYRYAMERNLKNVFITITLPTEYHPTKGIYHPKTGKLIKTIDNPRWIDDEDHSPRSGARELSRIYHRIQQLRAYRNISTDDKVYFRVYEPHKDGTPHLHASIFLPEAAIDDFVTSVQNWARKNGFSEYQIKIETDIKNPVAYLMKYILKTFDDLRQDEENITDLTLWYTYHGICRFYTSRTLISLEIYKKFRGSHDLLEVTKMYRNNEISILIETHTNKPVLITHGDYVVYNRKPITLNKTIYINYFSEIPKFWKLIIPEKIIIRKPPKLVRKIPDFISSEIDGKEAIYNPRSNTFHRLSDLQKPVSRMSVAERFTYRQNLIDELYNPFNDLEDMQHIEDKLLILDRYEMEMGFDI